MRLKLTQKQACIALLVLPEAESHSETGLYCPACMPEAEAHSETGLYCPAYTAWGRNSLRNRPVLPCLYCLRQKLTQKQACIAYCPACTAWGRNSLRNRPLLSSLYFLRLKLTQKQAFNILLVLPEAETHSETGMYCLLILPEAETHSETGLYCTACIAWGRNSLRNRPLLPCLYFLRQWLTQKHVSYWRKYVHEVLVNRLGGVSLPTKSVVRLTDRPDMTLDVYQGRKNNNATMQCTQKQAYITLLVLLEAETHSETGLYCPACTAWDRNSLRNKSFFALLILPEAETHPETYLYCGACTSETYSEWAYIGLLILPEAETHSETGLYCLLILPEAETHLETGLYCLLILPEAETHLETGLYCLLILPEAETHLETGLFYAPAYSKNSGRALSVTPVRPSVHMSHFRVRAITPKPYGIYSWNFTGAYITIRRCVMNKEDNSRVFGFWIISPSLNSRSCFSRKT